MGYEIGLIYISVLWNLEVVNFFFLFSTSAHCFAKQLSTVEKKGDHFRDSQTQTPTLANDKMQWYLTRSDRMRTFLDGFDVVTSGAIVSDSFLSFFLSSIKAPRKVSYLGNMPVRSPIVPVHQSAAFSVRFVIVMISPFLKPRSPA